MARFRQYPIVAVNDPEILNAPEEPKVEHWAPPWPGPVRRHPFAIAAAVLIATSGMAPIDPEILNQPEEPKIEQWWQPWGEPRWELPGNAYAAAMAAASGMAPIDPEILNQPEEPKIEQWWQRWSEPRWELHGNAYVATMAASGMAPIDPEILNQPEEPKLEHWWQPWSEPTPPKPALRAANQQFFIIDPEILNDPGAPPADTSLEDWWQPWAEPVRPKPALGAEQYGGGFQADLAAFKPDFDAWRFYHDGSESGSVPLAPENTDIDFDAVDNDPNFHIRMRVQETGGGDGSAIDDYEIQFQVDGVGDWESMDDLQTFIRSTGIGGLTNGAATTNRAVDGITDGSGSFAVGEQVQTTGTADVTNRKLPAGDFSEHVFNCRFFSADFSADHTFDFRLMLNRGVPEPNMINSVVPRLTHKQGSALPKWYQPLSEPTPPKPGLAAANQLAFIIDPEALNLPDAAVPDETLEDWWQSWSEPTPPKPALAAGNQQAFVIDPEILNQPEEQKVAQWWRPWPERLDPSALATYHAALRASGQAPIDPEILNQPEEQKIAHWWQPWSEPVRHLPGHFQSASQAAGNFAPPDFLNFAPDMDAWRFYYDGAEDTSAPIAPENTDIDVDAADVDFIFQLRFRVQETGGASGLTTDDYKIQRSANSGAWTDITGGAVWVRTNSGGGLTNGADTTNRATNGISDGTGSFVAGEQVEVAGTAEVTNRQLTADNFTEHAFSLKLVSSQISNDITFDFRLTLNGGDPGMANSAVPRINHTKGSALQKWFNPWSEPTPPKPGLAAANQQAFIIDPEALNLPDAAPADETLEDWWQPWSEPTPPKPALATANQQAFTVDPEILNQPEQQKIAHWWRPWPDQVPPSRAVAYHAAHSASGQAPIDPDILNQPELPKVDQWWRSWPESISSKPALAAANQLAFIIDPLALNLPDAAPDETLEDWWQPWSQLTPPKPALEAANQQAFVIDPEILNQPEQAKIEQWWQPWPEEVRPPQRVLYEAALAPGFKYHELSPFNPEMDAWRFYYDDGAEDASTPRAPENTDIDVDATEQTIELHLRLRVQELGGNSGATTDDYELQKSVDGGSFVKVSQSSTSVQSNQPGPLTNGADTTNRAVNGISDGTGSFVAGEQVQSFFDSEVTNRQLTANNFTEHVINLRLPNTHFDLDRTIDFRLALNTLAAPAPNMDNKVVPRITHKRGSALNKWFQPWRDPTPPKPGLAAANQLAFIIDPEALNLPDAAVPDETLEDWWRDWSRPTPPKPALAAANQQAFVIDPEIVNQPEQQKIAHWWRPWPERLDPAPLATYHAALRASGQAPIDPDILNQPEAPKVDQWWRSWIEEVRAKPGLAPTNQLAFIIDPNALNLPDAEPPDQVVEDWWRPWAEPTPPKPALAAANQLDLVIDPEVLNDPEEAKIEQYWRPWSEPVLPISSHAALAASGQIAIDPNTLNEPSLPVAPAVAPDTHDGGRDVHRRRARKIQVTEEEFIDARRRRRELVQDRKELRAMLESLMAGESKVFPKSTQRPAAVSAPISTPAAPLSPSLIAQLRAQIADLGREIARVDRRMKQLRRARRQAKINQMVTILLLDG